MLTKEQVLEAALNKSQTLDGRDLYRLADFFDQKDWPALGLEPNPEAPPHVPKEWTRELVLEQAKLDVAFGFEKALNQRAISSSLMYDVVQMWGWVLEEPTVRDCEEYAQYGLPLFKEAARVWGFKDEIPNDKGSENKFSENGNYDHYYEED
jgi:hypothetical protein